MAPTLLHVALHSTHVSKVGLRRKVVEQMEPFDVRWRGRGKDALDVEEDVEDWSACLENGEESIGRLEQHWMK